AKKVDPTGNSLDIYLCDISASKTAAVSFFFQAEDGIRVFHVTGVQTCALPICSLTCSPGLVRANCLSRFRRRRNKPRRRRSTGRSEERRVGKEGICRWTAHP